MKFLAVLLAAAALGAVVSPVDLQVVTETAVQTRAEATSYRGDCRGDLFGVFDQFLLVCHIPDLRPGGDNPLDVQKCESLLGIWYFNEARHCDTFDPYGPTWEARLRQRQNDHLLPIPGFGALIGDNESEIAQSKGRIIAMQEEFSERCVDVERRWP